MPSKLAAINDFLIRTKLVYWTLGVLVVLFLSIWYHSWSNVTGQIDELIDSNSGLLEKYQIQLNCEDRSYSGYPFNIILNCHSPEMILDKSIQVNGESLRVIFDTPDFNIFRFELDGPVRFQSEIPEYRDLSINWDQFQLTIATLENSIKSIAIRTDSVIAEQKLRTEINDYNLAYFNFQIRNVIEGIDALTKLTLKAGEINQGDGSVLMKYADLDFAIKVPSSGSLSENGILDSFATLLKNGGNLALNHFRIDSKGVVTDFGGNLNMLPDGMLSGDLKFWISGAEKLVSHMNQNASEGDGTLIGKISRILTLVPKKEKNGLSGIEIPIEIKNGEVQIGTVPFGTMPSLYWILGRYLRS